MEEIKINFSEYIEIGKKIFPICRSITGDGNRKTLRTLQEKNPEIKIHEISSGKKVFDWKIPPEWNVKEAYVKNPDGKKIIDFKKNNLHLINYSIPINKKIKFNELINKIYSLEKQPEAIPYITSYYKKDWGFCVSENFKKKLLKKYKNNKNYFYVKINSKFNKKGSLTYADCLIKGKSNKEILISTYICHPSMANNELSGPLLANALINFFKKQNNELTLRFIFVPEIIGSIAYIYKNLKILKKNFVAGYNLTCVGDERNYSFLSSKNENSLTNKAAIKILNDLKINFKKFSFLERASDEGNYNSIGVDLDVASFMRSKYGEFIEYHTSHDDFNLVTKKGLEGSFAVIKEIILSIMKNKIPINIITCEPQLGKRGLHPTLGTKEKKTAVRNILNFLQFADGSKDLIDLSNILKLSFEETYKIYKILLDKRLIKKN
jgi:aminopeptidase-like protein